jgi:hypothetical protein
MNSHVRCCALVALVGCTSEEPEPSFYGSMDARVAMSDAAIGDADIDAQSDASRVEELDAQVPPGSESGRLAGFTAAHNAARARLATEPPLGALSWSSEIALVAQAYADALAAGCADTLTHSQPADRNHWGENLASFGIMGGSGFEPNGSPERTVALWESELACYTYGPFEPGTNATCTDACAIYGGCGHYTQLVWRDTTRVGCGVADCRRGPWRKSYWVCNYDPTGNFLGEFPY